MHSALFRIIIGVVISVLLVGSTLTGRAAAEPPQSTGAIEFKDEKYMLMEVPQLKAAAEAGDFRAMKRLIAMLETSGSTQEEKKWRKRFEETAPAAAENGDIDAAYALYEHRIKYTSGEDGEPLSKQERMVHVLPLAAAGSDQAMYDMAKDLLDPSKQPQEVIRYYEMAYENGHAGAAYELGMMYSQTWFPRHDYVKAMKWMEKAAQGKFYRYWAANDLAHTYAVGKNGVPVDDVKAAFYREIHAQTGAPLSMVLTGLNYAKGIGVPVNAQVAAEWFKAAGVSNAEGAMNFLKTEPVYWADLIAKYSAY